MVLEDLQSIENNSSTHFVTNRILVIIQFPLAANNNMDVSAFLSVNLIVRMASGPKQLNKDTLYLTLHSGEHMIVQEVAES